VPLPSCRAARSVVQLTDCHSADELVLAPHAAKPLQKRG
jgi:hypothetical protein